MKKIMMHICEYCNTTFIKEEQAEECEKTHKKIAKIRNVKYEPIFRSLTKYPSAIDVEMDDGEVITYLYHPQKRTGGYQE